MMLTNMPGENAVLYWYGSVCAMTCFCSKCPFSQSQNVSVKILPILSCILQPQLLQVGSS